MIAAAACFFLAAANAPSEASTISGSYSGHITNLNFGVAAAGAPDIKLNDPFEVDYSYDTTAPVYSTTSGSLGDVGTTYYGTTFSLTVGAFHISFAEPKIDVDDFPASSSFADEFMVWGCSCFETVGSDIPGWNVDAMFLGLLVPSSTFNGTDLPTSPLDPANDYPPDELQLTLKQPETNTEYLIFGSIKPQVAATPLPGSGALLLTAFGGLGFTAWTRRRA
jgi:hypothetical protein